MSITEIPLFSALRYRIYFAAQKLGITNKVGGWPWLVRRLRQVKALVARRLLPKQQVWVRARAGLSQGMWMRLYLPDEAIHWRGEHERDVQNVIRAVVRPSAVVYDIGSHVGSLALGTARLVGEFGRVIAFDGDPDNVATLQESSLRNHLETRIEVVHAAVWSSTARQGIPFRRGGARRSQGGVEVNQHRPVTGTGEIITVPAITLDDFIAAGGPAPQLVKIDVEGGEYEVLCGGASLFTHQRPLIIVEVHLQLAAKQIENWLVEHHYCARWTIPKENFPRCLFAWPREYDGITSV